MATAMQISDAGLALIKEFEGFVNHIYPDSKGHSAIGYGHNLHAGETFPATITEDQATALLRVDCSYAEHAVNTLVTSLVGQKQQQFDALVCFTYNLGATTLKGSTLLAAVNSGQYTKAATQFPIWDHLNGEDCRGLLKRRVQEMLLFLSNLPSDVKVLTPVTKTA